jgi:hypothetical protein
MTNKKAPRPKRFDGQLNIKINSKYEDRSRILKCADDKFIDKMRAVLEELINKEFEAREKKLVA